jgi:hypothetical protein
VAARCARTQQSERVRRIGVLVGSAEDEPDIKERLARIDPGFAADRADQFQMLAKGWSSAA